MEAAMTSDSDAERASVQMSLYAMSVDLTGSRCGPLFGSVRVLVDGLGKQPAELRRLCAEFYEIPVEQVGAPEPTTQEAFDAES
jgi:hypothetical protein